jgi:hypothetical protein
MACQVSQLSDTDIEVNYQQWSAAELTLMLEAG